MLGVPMRSRRDGTAQGLGDVHTVGGTATGAVGGGVVVKEHSHAQHTKVFSRVREAFWEKKSSGRCADDTTKGADDTTKGQKQAVCTRGSHW
jgi:hypothetical protein